MFCFFKNKLLDLWHLFKRKLKPTRIYPVLKFIKQLIKSYITNIDVNFDEFIASTLNIGVGVVLLADRAFFYWPPELTKYLNDKRIDIFIIILGFAILWCTITDNQSKFWSNLVLMTGSAQALAMLCFQVLHICGTGDKSMGMACVIEMCIFALCVHVARNKAQ